MKLFITCFLLFASFELFYLAETVRWGYKGYYGPSRWSNFYRHCGGQKQSPIDLKTRLMRYNRYLKGSLLLCNYQFTFSYYTPHFEMENNGHTLKVGVAEAGAGVLLLGTGYFLLDQFHFHWGSENDKGSEHQFNGKSFSAELHLVHHNYKYSSLNKALDKPNGLAVLGVFIKVGYHNHAFDQFLSYIRHGEDLRSDQKRQIPGFSIRSLLPHDTESFIRYQGSLTTPPCYETVTWTIFKTPISISHYQLEVFRSLKDSHGDSLEDNFRPVQPLNRRSIETSYYL